MPHPAAALQRRLQDGLGVMAVGHLCLDVVLASTRDDNAIEGPKPGHFRVPFHGNSDHLPAGRSPHVLDSSAHYYLAAVEDCDRLAKLLDLVHLVGGKDERLASVAHLQKGLFEHRGVHRVEAREGLVHQQDLGIVEDRGYELDLLLIAFRKLLGPAIGVLRDAEAFQPAASFALGRIRFHAVKLGKEDELVENLHLGV